MLWHDFNNARNLQMRVVNDVLRVVLLFLLASLTVSQLAKMTVFYDDFAALRPESAPSQNILISLFGIVSIAGGLGYDYFRRFASDVRLMFIAMMLAVLSTALIMVPDRNVILLSRAGEAMAHILFVISAPAVAFLVLPERSRTAFMALWGTFFTVGFLINEGFLARMVRPSVVDFWILQPALLLVGAILAFALFRISPAFSSDAGSGDAYGDSRQDLTLLQILPSISLSIAFFLYATMFIVWKIRPELGLADIEHPAEPALLSIYALGGNLLAIFFLWAIRARWFAQFLMICGFLALSAGQLIATGQASELKFAMLGILPVAIFSCAGSVAQHPRHMAFSVSLIMIAGNLATFAAPVSMRVLSLGTVGATTAGAFFLGLAVVSATTVSGRLRSALAAQDGKLLP
jgi:hypothetical protein